MFSRKLTAIAAGMLLLASSRAMAVESALINRAPADGNLILAVDAAAFLNSPVAADQGWGKSSTDAFPKSPNPLPNAPGLQQLVVSADIDTRTAQMIWQTGVLKLDAVNLSVALARRGGEMDSIEGLPVAAVRGDLFFIDFGNQVLGVVWPADRRFTAQWIRQGSTRSVSTYLSTAAAQAGAATPVVLAMDLSDTVSEANVRRRLTDDPPAAGIDPAVIAPIMASLQGVTIKIAMGDAVNPKTPTVAATLDFSKNAAAFAPVAKPIIMDVLAQRGLSIPDINQWQFTAAGSSVNVTGPLAIKSLDRIMQLVSAPGPGPMAAATPAANADPGTAPQIAAQTAVPQESKALASKAYYQGIASMLDDISSGPSLKDNAGMLMSDARKIDQLPILNVDPDLVNWGSDVAAAMRNSASTFAIGQQKVNEAVYSVPTVDTSQYDANTRGDMQAEAARRTAADQRRQNAAASKAQTLDAAYKPIQDVLDSRNKIRQVMVQRYQIEF
jgi:hypothetical protein